MSLRSPELADGRAYSPILFGLTSSVPTPLQIVFDEMGPRSRLMRVIFPIWVSFLDVAFIVHMTPVFNNLVEPQVRYAELSAESY